jgi:hypothetical protein
MGYEIEVLYVGDIPKELKDRWTPNRRIFKVIIPNLSITELELKIHPRLKLRLETINTTEELIPVNQCLIYQHLFGINVKIEDEEYLRLKKQVNEFNKEKKKGFFGRLFGKKEEKIFTLDGKIKLFGIDVLREKSELVQDIWQKNEEKLKRKNKDFVELEEDFRNRMQNLRDMYDNHINELQETINKLQRELIVQPLAYGNKVTEVISDSVIKNISTEHISNEELREEIKQLNDILEGRRQKKTGNERLFKESLESKITGGGG